MRFEIALGAGSVGTDGTAKWTLAGVASHVGFDFPAIGEDFSTDLAWKLL